MNIKGKFVTLRAIEKADLQLLTTMLNDPEIENLVVGWSYPVSIYQQCKWYENQVGDTANLRFIIETPADGAVGLATLTEIDWKNRSATHGIKILKSQNRTKGIGTDTVMTIMRYAFDELQLHRLDGSWFDENTASKTLYTKCGWKVEGIRRSCIYKNGTYRDLMISGILDQDYYELLNQNNYWKN